jgi:hypothetical protein
MCGLTNPAVGQATLPQQQQPPIKPPQFKPVPLEHLYWHFLTLQNFLDTKAATQKSQGKDGSRLRSDLQRTLGWSDADYAPIHTSSTRLTAEVRGLDAQAIMIRKSGVSSSSRDQLKALTVQREAHINFEMSYLKQNLPPDKIKMFEAFLTQFFSPANAMPQPPIATRKPAASGSPAPAAVQK